MPSRYARIADSGHPLTEHFAVDLYLYTPVAHWPPGFARRTGTWENEPPELRAAFRDRARRFMAGDMRVAPWVLNASPAEFSTEQEAIDGAPTDQ